MQTFVAPSWFSPPCVWNGVVWAAFGGGPCARRMDASSDRVPKRRAYRRELTHLNSVSSRSRGRSLPVQPGQGYAPAVLDCVALLAKQCPSRGRQVALPHQALADQEGGHADLAEAGEVSRREDTAFA